MKIVITDKNLGILPENKEEEIQTLDFFTYKDLSKVFSNGSYDVKKIKKVKLIKKKEASLITDAGFFHEFILFCKKNELKITEAADKRTKFTHQKKEYTDEELSIHFPFDYNEHQIRALRKLLKCNVGTIKATTSAGKTQIFIALVKEIRVPTLILLNKVSLVVQTYDRLIKSGIKNVGVCHGKDFKDGDVVVSTIGSVYKLKNFSKFQCVVIDEVHNAHTTAYQKFLEENIFPLRFGFSATPEGNKDEYKYALVRRFVGSIIEEVGNKEMLDNGVIARPIIRFEQIQAPTTPDYPSAYSAGIVENQDRNNRIKKICEEYNQPTLILIKIIEHGEILERMIPNSLFVRGENSIQEREDAIKKLEDGEIKFLISSGIFNEGISINCIRVLIIASAGLSDISTIQRIGRALRLDEGKKEALVFDFEDYGNRFLEKHSKHRKNIYKKLGFEIAN